MSLKDRDRLHVLRELEEGLLKPSEAARRLGVTPRHVHRLRIRFKEERDLRAYLKCGVLMSYPGEPHHLTKYENQKDCQIRMRQFFDHYLWEKPSPRWMESGRSFLERGAQVLGG